MRRGREYHSAPAASSKHTTCHRKEVLNVVRIVFSESSVSLSFLGFFLLLCLSGLCLCLEFVFTTQDAFSKTEVDTAGIHHLA